MRTPSLVVLLPLALLAGLCAACSPQRGPVDDEAAAARSSALDDVTANEAAAEPMDDVSRSLAELHYGIVERWFRRAGLTEYTYADLVELDGELESASRYVRCHEWSRSPSGNVGRLELLSLCLREATVDALVPPASMIAERSPPSTSSE